MATYRLDIAYDGSRFHGYAVQPNVRTVQEELERALAHHIPQLVTVVAGRTDKGVHATGQVVSFSTQTTFDIGFVHRSLNRQLRGEIVVTAMTAVDGEFHARFSATGRRYHYSVINRAFPMPLLRRMAWHVKDPLDLELMNTAAADFVGQHDFASFCRKSPGRSTERSVRSARWSRSTETDGLLTFDIEASSFCHQMVRSVVALLVDIGRGRMLPDSVPQILQARNRHIGRGVAPPSGLTLVAVSYDQRHD